MKPEVSRWAGRIYGTNTGNLYLEFRAHDQSASEATGTWRILDDRHGIHVFEVKVRFEDGKVSIEGRPSENDDFSVGMISVEGNLSSEGKIEGSWETAAGYGGTFHLFPHSSNSHVQRDAEIAASSAQLFSKRQQLGPINIDRAGLITLSKRLSVELDGGQVVVTIEGDTQQSMFLSDFEASDVSFASATFAKLHVQLPERDGLNRVLSIEFGQNENFILAQSSDESWAVGVTIRIQRFLREYELPRIMSPTKFGVSINQIILLGAIAYLPSISTLQTRVVYLVGVVSIVAVIHWANNRLIPNAMISLDSERISAGRKILQRATTWAFALVALSLTAFLTSKIDELWKIIEAIILS